VVIAAVALYATSLESYVLFHSMAELFSIVIAAGIFVVAWNTRKFMPNAYLLFVGIAYLYIAFIDLVHTLAYKGMGVFPGAGANLPTQLWIAGRYLEAVSLLAAPFFLGKKLRVVPVAIAYFFATVLVLLSIHSGVFPDCFIEGRGLTPFKVGSEYVISLILAAAIIYLRQKREYFEKPVMNLLIWSIITTIASEMAFTLYKDVYGFFNLLGHYFKIVSFYLIYAALIKTNLKIPYESLVHEIDERKQAEEKMLKLNRIYAVISQINQTIVREREQDKILSEACRIAVEYGKFRMAWIGMIDAETKLVKPVAYSGVEEGYLSKIKGISVDDVPAGRGPTGTAIREGRHYVCDDIEKDPSMEIWKEEALRRGYRSSMALPIRQFGNVIGAFSLYASVPGF
ncbi:MAG: MASE3 domain-containing protein, partial [Deltaproteobacteria bacterium]|nr:MASE3 domain-containing protein [Deltaproteobacteria bacterium]